MKLFVLVAVAPWSATAFWVAKREPIVVRAAATWLGQRLGTASSSDSSSPASSMPTNVSSRREALWAALLPTLGLGLGVGIPTPPALARGRDTQRQAWSRYSSRVNAMRSWLAGDLKELIQSSNFEGLKDQTAKKSVTSSYLGALDLWASSYSDAGPSPKTNAMRADVDKMRNAVSQLNASARRSLGEQVKAVGGGGIFGLGGGPAGSNPTPSEARAAAIEAFNDYAKLNNDGHPLDIDPLKTIPAD